MAVLGAYLSLMLGATLEVAALGFAGLDLLIGACFTAAAACGGLAYLTGARPRQGLLTMALGTIALVFHIWLNTV